MNAKLILAAVALTVSMGTASTIANADANAVFNHNVLCAVADNCAPPAKKYLALGRVKHPPIALGRVHLPVEHDFCALARNAIAASRPTAGALVQRCLAAGGNVNLPPAELPPVVIAQPAPAPQPSGSNVDPGDYENASNDGISCGEGRNIVRHSGFSKVHTIDCSSDVFTYSAKKHDQFFKVFVNTDGDIVHVNKLGYF